MMHGSEPDDHDPAGIRTWASQKEAIAMEMPELLPVPSDVFWRLDPAAGEPLDAGALTRRMTYVVPVNRSSGFENALSRCIRSAITPSTSPPATAQ